MNNVFVPYVPSRHDPLTGERVPIHDLQPAQQYGTPLLVIPTTEIIRPDNIQDLIEEVREDLKHYSAGDSVVCIGDPLLVAAAISKACEVAGSCHVLHWDRRKQTYNRIEVKL